jgi:predicted GNAT family acetyltransferase
VSTEVADNPVENRYEILVDGHLAGYIRYRLRETQITLWHTEMETGYEGRGLAAELGKVALDDVKERGLELVPLCPFITKYIRRHPEDYLDIVAADYREKVMKGGG